jgi:hypothetical protein
MYAYVGILVIMGMAMGYKLAVCRFSRERDALRSVLKKIAAESK